MHALLVFPLLIPFVTAVACLLAWRYPLVQRSLSLVGNVLALCAAIALLAAIDRYGIQATPIGSWPAPVGITLVADLFSAIMVTVGAAMGLSAVVYSLASIDEARQAYGFYPVLNVLLMGVSGAFLTGDLFNLFVWFEVMLIASFVLIALGGERGQLEGATKYVTLNLLSSTLFLSAAGILYGIAGTLNMADLSGRLLEVAPSGIVVTVAMMFLVAFGIKSAMFPLFFWLPASYHTPPVVVSAIFAGMLTKVGVYALIRTFTLMFRQDTGFTHDLILVLSGLTMISGVLGAVAQSEFRRILSFHIVSQIGYMTMGLGLFSRLALAGSIFYIVHHIVVKTNLFFVSGVVERLRGTYELKTLGGLYVTNPALAALFSISALSLAGMPPLSGFWAKLFLVQAGIERGQYAIVGVALVVGLLTLFSMSKIWQEAFWKPLPVGARRSPVASEPERGAGIAVMLAPVTVLACTTVIFGCFAAPLFDMALRTADQLLDPSAYVTAVMEAGR